MNTRTDHYTYLGVPMGASSADIVSAIERMGNQADHLQQSDPGGAQMIREKLRRAREDLLSSPQRREGYDRWLLTKGGSAEQERTVAQPLPGLAPTQPPEQQTSVMPIQQNTVPPGPSTSRNRWLVPLLIVAALFVGAGGALAATQLFGHKATVVVSATATSAPAPTATVQATAKPTANPTSAPATATVPPASTPAATTQATAQTTAAPAADPLTADPAVIKSRGYTPEQSHAETSDGSGGTLYAWEGVCTGSADGYCRKVFFFDGTRFLGTDTLNSSTAINSVQEAGPAKISVTYANYAKNDPLCCPSGKPVTITYQWNGSKLIPSGTPPGNSS